MMSSAVSSLSLAGAASLSTGLLGKEEGNGEEGVLKRIQGVNEDDWFEGESNTLLQGS